MLRVKLKAAAFACAALLIGTVQASPQPLVDMGDGTVWDPNKSLFWLKDWNVNGRQNWATQMNWASSLTFAGHTGWYLPEEEDITYLFNEFGNLTLVSEFTHVQVGAYWTSTERVPGDSARAFYPNDLGKGSIYEANRLFAVAMYPGEPPSSFFAVPEPASLALAGLALAGMAATRRRKQ